MIRPAEARRRGFRLRAASVDVTEQSGNWRRRCARRTGSKDEFLALLAHELRNPLAPLRNGLQVMRLAAGDAERRRPGPRHDGPAARRTWCG